MFLCLTVSAKKPLRELFLFLFGKYYPFYSFISFIILILSGLGWYSDRVILCVALGPNAQKSLVVSFFFTIPFVSGRFFFFD